MKPSDRHYTESQNRTLKQMLNLAALQFSGNTLKTPTQMRFNPLIVGPTGAGKSFLVEEAAARSHAHYVKVTYGDWIVQGARSESTLSIILKAVAKHPRVLLHIDELDKIGSEATGVDSTWGRSIQTDLWNVLDYNIPALPSDESDQNPVLRRMSASERKSLVRSRLWIVGSGTWQELFDCKKETTFMGFGNASSSTRDETFQERIIRSKVIPKELPARFHSDILVIDYPSSPEEIETLLNAFKITQLAKELGKEIDLNDIQRKLAIQGMRVFESIQTTLYVEQYERTRNDTEQLQFPAIPEATLSASSSLEDAEPYEGDQSFVPGQDIPFVPDDDGPSNCDILESLNKLNEKMDAELSHRFSKEVGKPALCFKFEILSYHQLHAIGEILPELELDDGPQYAAKTRSCSDFWMHRSPASWGRPLLQQLKAHWPHRPLQPEPDFYLPDEKHACDDRFQFVGLGALEATVYAIVSGGEITPDRPANLIRWKSLFESIHLECHKAEFLLGRRLKPLNLCPELLEVEGWEHHLVDPFSEAGVLIHDGKIQSDEAWVQLLLKTARETILENPHTDRGLLHSYLDCFQHLITAAETSIAKKS